ncbi:MAG TPA: methyltransferase [Chitinophagaceae bacterium]|nr:methyltransferase [Chitinophagaceae bacterium]
MGKAHFAFKQFTVHQDKCAMKVTTDACLFGAWCANDLQNKKVSTGLDVGSGTGLLSLMVVQKNDVNVHAIEIDKDAAEQAEENVAASPFSSKINVFHTDAAEFRYHLQYDFIISNPPFYENELQSSSATRNLAHHNGLRLQSLLEIIKINLSATGAFYLLLPYKRCKEAELLISQSKLTLNEKCIVSPSPSHLPQRVMLKGSLGASGSKESFVFIKDERDNYSTEFVSLLKDYYLYL